MSVPRWQGEMRMKLERLETLYHGHGSVHYKGELYDIADVNKSKQTAQISRVGSMLEPLKVVKASELD